MASVPSKMRGIVIEETGGVDKLKWSEELAVPEVKEGQVLVKNEFIGVNYIDTYFRTGLYKAHLPLITGKEGAGTVVFSSAPDFKPGDRVGYILDHAYAEYTALPADHLIPLPAAIPTKTAAASLLQGLTALAFIREIPVKEGSTVLVLAAAGGVGQWLVQILKSMNCTIIAAAGSDAKVDLAKSLGADFGINYSTSDLGEAVKALAAGECKTAYGGPDVIFDGIGAATFETDLDVIARKGTLVSYGNASGAVPPVNLLRLGSKCVKLMRPVLFGYIATKEERLAYANELFGLLESGRLKVSVHEIYDLKDVARAHTDLEGRKTTGKLLLKI